MVESTDIRSHYSLVQSYCTAHILTYCRQLRIFHTAAHHNTTRQQALDNDTATHSNTKAHNKRSDLPTRHWIRLFYPAVGPLTCILSLSSVVAMPAPIAASTLAQAASSAGATMKSPRGTSAAVTTMMSPSKRGTTPTSSEPTSASHPIVRQLITAPLAPTSSPPPPVIPAQQPPAAKGAAAVAVQPPLTPTSPATYPWTFSLPYYPSPSHLLSRFVLSRLDDDTQGAPSKSGTKDPKRKAATASTLPPPTVEAVDPNVTLALHCPSTACLLHVYDYDEWQHCALPTHTLLNVCEGDVDGRLKAERRVVGEGELLVDALPLTRERPLLVEVYIDPLHLSSDVHTFHIQQQLKRTNLPALASTLLSTAASAPAASPSSKTTKKLSAAEKKPAGAVMDVDEPVRDSWPFVLSVVAASASGVAVALDVTSEEKRRERRAEREKAEPGRARRARATRERWMDEEKKRTEGGVVEEESKEQMLVEWWPEEKEQVTLVTREERQAEKQRRAAETEEAQSFRYVLGELRRIQAKVEDEGDREDEKQWKEWREREQQAVQQEKAERALLRAQQQQEESDMQAVRNIIAARAQEREVEKERKAGEGNTQRSGRCEG